MLKLSDLALRPDFDLGPISVSPARRKVRGPAGEIQLEPLVMQVFLLLLDLRGTVVTRNALFDQVWGGVMVGDDSLNRAIACVRRIAAETAPGLFEIETIPRTGYRMTGAFLAEASQPTEQIGTSEPTPPLSRRGLIGTGAAAAAIAGAGSLWWVASDRGDSRFDELMTRGNEAFRDGSAFDTLDIRSNDSPEMINLYEEAVRLRPDSASAWGLLAYFRSARADEASAENSARLVAEAHATIRRALALREDEPNARVAMYLFEGRMLDWTARDRRLREILTTDPNNLLAMGELMTVVQAAGLTRESWALNERILRASPLARPYLVVRSMKLWILGRIRESDNVIDRVRGLWPDYFFALWVRFLLFAVTGRPRAALAILDSNPDTLGRPVEQKMWRVVLEALETRNSSAIASARQACFEVARKVPSQVNDVVMVLCALGEVDAAFEVTQGFLLWRGNVVSDEQANGKAMDDYSRRMTQWLFTPPVAVMRADPRFAKLCEDFGLTAYWRARNVRPDYQVYG